MIAKSVENWHAAFHKWTTTAQTPTREYFEGLQQVTVFNG